MLGLPVHIVWSSPQVGYGVSIACTVPMVLLPMRDALSPLFNPLHKSAANLTPSQFRVLTVGILVWCVPITSAF